ncbi:MAG: Alpha/beta hydrolase fold-3 domain protein [Gammaproteobacteria bacterium]|nr:Alpha/beta hydrolase fold-3 domain protein [Gammaproteobacteria bacterium]
MVHSDRTLITASEADRVWFEALVRTAQARAASQQLPDLVTLRRGAVDAANTPLSRPVPANVEVTAQDAGGVAAWWFRPEDRRRESPLLYFHGGGYVCGSVEAERGVAAALATAFNAPVLAVGYRQAPEHPFPAAIDDAWTSFSWLARTCRNPITLVGDSAGGNLAVVTAARAGREMPGSVRTAIATSAWFDVSMSTPSWTHHQEVDLAPRELGVFFRDCYLGSGHSGNLPRPPNEADFSGCAPLLIQAGGLEMGLDDSELLAAAAARAGVLVRYEIYQPMPHNFVKFARPTGDFAIARMAAWEKELDGAARR